MTIDDYVNEILNSPVHVFDSIVQKLIGRNADFAKIELQRHSVEVDVVLIESIKSILHDLKKEESILSRFFYLTFGIELRKNKRRKQLLYLGSELKNQQHKVQSRLHRILRHKERVSYILVDLDALREGLLEQSILFDNNHLKNKSKFYEDEVKFKMGELNKMKLALQMKYNNLLEVQKLYNTIFKNIPRYASLEDTKHL